MTDLPASVAADVSLRNVDTNPTPATLRLGTHRTADGLPLRLALAAPDGAVRGTILILQGRNEVLEKYFETMGELLAEGFAVASFDWRGQGGSGRQTPLPAVGHVGSLDTLADDLVEILHALPASLPGPVAILAHSMGGLVALHASERIEHLVERMVLSAPLVEIPGSASRRRLIGLLCSGLHWTGLGFLPVRRAALPRAEPERSDLSSDPRRLARNAALAWAGGDWSVGGLSASWLRAVLRATRRLRRSDVVARLAVPTLILTAGADTVVSPAASARLAWRMRSGHGITIPGARHEILQEADRFRAPALAAMLAFLDSVLPRVEVPPLDVSAIARSLEAELG